MKVVPAIKGIGEDGIYLVKECNAHGKFQTLIWEGNAADYLSWGRENLSAETPVNPKVKEKSCPDNCGLCEEHERKGCCMILEVTKRCNMHCPVCFASAGEEREKGDIPICEIEKQYDFLMAHGGPFNIQLSGGEPTMRDDLPEIIHMGREKGFTFLGFNYRLTETGRIIMTLNSDSVKHERKTLVRMVHKSQRGELEPEKVDEHHNSWENNADKGNSYKVKQRTQKYLKQLRKGEEHGSKKNDSDTCGSGRGREPQSNRRKAEKNH